MEVTIINTYIKARLKILGTQTWLWDPILTNPIRFTPWHRAGRGVDAEGQSRKSWQHCQVGQSGWPSCSSTPLLILYIILEKMNYPFQTKTKTKCQFSDFRFPFFGINSIFYRWLYNLQLQGYGKVEISMVRSINWCSVIMDCVCSTSKLKEELVMYWKNYSSATVWLINGSVGNSLVWAGTMSNPYNTYTGFSRFSTCKADGCLLFIVLQSFSFSLWRVCMQESPTAGCVRNASRAADEVQADLAEVQDRPHRHSQMTRGWFEVCMIHIYIYIYMILCV